jgi:hypothetical protein
MGILTRQVDSTREREKEEEKEKDVRALFCLVTFRFVTFNAARSSASLRVLFVGLVMRQNNYSETCIVCSIFLVLKL